MTHLVGLQGFSAAFPMLFHCAAQIQPCPIKTTHPWEHCCYAHPHENARRRDPRKYRYIAEPCPDYKHGICLLVRTKGDGRAGPPAHLSCRSSKSWPDGSRNRE